MLSPLVLQLICEGVDVFSFMSQLCRLSTSGWMWSIFRRFPMRGPSVTLFGLIQKTLNPGLPKPQWSACACRDACLLSEVSTDGWSQSEIYTRLTLRPNNAACGLTAGKCKWLHPWWLRRCDRGGHITPRARQQFEVVPTPESKWLDLSRSDDLAAEFIEFLWEVREHFFSFSNFIFCR